MMYRQYNRYLILLMIADVILTVVVMATLVEARPFLPGRELAPELVLPHSAIFVMIAVIWFVSFSTTGAYDPLRIRSLSMQMGRFTSAHLMATFVFAGVLYFTFRDMSRMLVVYFCIADYFVLMLIRYLLAAYLRIGKGGNKTNSVVIVGISESGRNLAQTIMGDHSSVLRVVGFVDDESIDDDTLPARFMGTIGDLPRLIKDYAVDMVVIALPDKRFPELESLIFMLESLPVRVYVVSDLLKLALVQGDVERMGDLVVIGLREPVIQGTRRVVKRTLDLLVSTLVLALAWPLMILIWVAVKLDSPGPGLFSSERVGENGSIFRMYKFRTMHVGAADLVEEVATRDEQGRPIFKVRNDPRVTRVGRVLRRTSLDELPQLYNVLKGEMSLVGPRPEQPFITVLYDHWQWQRLSVPPGVTGWWQVSGRSDLPMHQNTQYDVYYVKNYSLLLDLKILFRTLGVVIRGKGAY
jgi:exopolysaccharide biosynthesis polyprenyl glycosylphosphotransferase